MKSGELEVGGGGGISAVLVPLGEMVGSGGGG